MSIIKIKLSKEEKKKNANRDKQLREVLSGKRLPIVTLDTQWHALYPENMKTNEIKRLENNLMTLLKKQGEMTNEVKKLKKEKTRVMGEIVATMDQPGGHDDEKRSKAINDINEKVDKMEKELEDEIPELIKEANLELVIESINCAYTRMNTNAEEIKVISEWILNVRNELKEKIIIKQDKEIQNTNIYSYLHNIMGPDLMEIFDISEPKN